MIRLLKLMKRNEMSRNIYVIYEDLFGRNRWRKHHGFVDQDRFDQTAGKLDLWIDSERVST